MLRAQINQKQKQLDNSNKNASSSEINLHLSGQNIQQKQLVQPELDSISTIITNIKLLCSLLIIKEPVPFQVLQIYKPKILSQLNFMNDTIQKFNWRNNKIQLLQDLVTKFQAKTHILDYNCFSNLSLLNTILHQLYEQIDKIKMGQTTQANFNKSRQISSLNMNSSKISYLKMTKIIAAIKVLWIQLFQIVQQDNFTIQRLENYDVYSNNLEKKEDKENNILDNLADDHYLKQLINCKIDYPPQVFSWVQPPLHTVYISQASRAYNIIAPVKIKHIMPFNEVSPKIMIDNYFKQETEAQKAILCCAKPKTKTLVYYRIDDICKLSTMEKQYAHEVQLPIKWIFSPDSRLVTTPSGQIFGINCRTSKQRTDRSMYEITQQKVSNRGQIPQPKRQASIIYLKDCIYVIGGKGPNEPCSKKGFRYIIKEKKWEQIAESNYSLRKPTLCIFQNKYIFKIGGINEFDYLNKGFQMYDSVANSWGIVRVSLSNGSQQIQILQDSLATQINDDQIYIFGGKNGNKFSSDKGFVLNINQIRQRKNKPPKVSGQSFSVSVGTRNCYSFFGCYSQSNVISYGNSLYVLRKNISTLPKLF